MWVRMPSGTPEGGILLPGTAPPGELCSLPPRVRSEGGWQQLPRGPGHVEVLSG